MRLYDHQLQMVASVLNAYSDGQRAIVAVMPTGSGKTPSAGQLVRILRPPTGRRGRALWICHREELGHQALKMFAWDGPFPMGAYHPSQLGFIQGENNDVDRPITVALVQSLQQEKRRTAYKQWGLADIIIIDECHHALAQSYQTIISDLLAPGGLLLGITATPFRSDNRTLARVFPDGIVYAIGILDLMVKHNPETGQSFLADLKSIIIDTDVQVNGVPLKDGEFNHELLAERLAKSLDRYTKAVAAWKRFAQDRPTLVFASDIQDAYMFVETFKNEGIACDLILGHTHPEQREYLLGNPALTIPSALQTGDIQVLVSVGVLLEGIDLPFVSCGVDGRIPQFAGTFQQMVGRVIRSYPGKDDALWISLAPCDHDLMTVERFLGSDKPLGNQSVREFIEEQEKTAKPEDDLLTQLGNQNLTYTIDSQMKPAFEIKGAYGTWRQSTQSLSFSLHSANGIYELTPYGTNYAVDWTSPGGRHEQLVGEPVSKQLAMAFAYNHARRAIEGKAEREQRFQDNGPLTAYTRTVAQRRRIGYLNPDGSEKTERQVQILIEQRNHFAKKPARKKVDAPHS